MDKPLLGQKVAVLVANGFSESELISVQKELLKAGANIRIIAMDHGLVNSWNGQGWGLNFAVDQALNEALAVDYDILIVPGGKRSVEKLQLTAHTKRFINGFLNSRKPLVISSESIELLVFSGKGEGLSVCSVGDNDASIAQSGFDIQSAHIVEDGNLLSFNSVEGDMGEHVSVIVDYLVRAQDSVLETVAA